MGAIGYSVPLCSESGNRWVYLSAKFCWLLCLQRTWLEENIYTQVGDTKYSISNVMMHLSTQQNNYSISVWDCHNSWIDWKHGLGPKCMVLYTMVSSIHSPSQHMHIVFTSERLVLLKLACTYATWNQKAQRLDYVSQASILQLYRAMELAIGVHPCRRILVCT